MALELADELDALGHRDEVLAIARGADAARPRLPALVDTSRLGARVYLQGGWRLRRRLVSAPADVVVAHGGSAAILVAFAPAEAAAAVWNGFSASDPDCGAGLGAASADRQPPVRRRGLFTGALETEARESDSRDPCGSSRPRAVDRRGSPPSTAPLASAWLRTEIGIGADVPLLGFVGHLVDQKHPELAVDVLAEVRRRGQPAQLVMAGDGPRRAAVEQRIAERYVAGAATLLGHRDDPESVFGGSISY